MDNLTHTLIGALVGETAALTTSPDSNGLAPDVRRVGRVVSRTFAEVDLPVKVCTAFFLAVVAAGTLVYHFGVHKSVGQGLFRTVSVISTGADLHEDELAEDWQRVFVSVLRVVGAVLTAAFTAIITAPGICP